jgi:redox-sensitive bicupin YhaK (pirin superfamily)
MKKLIKRPAGERGHSDFGWLDSRHTFSFGEYHDPAHRGFHSLRVINDDRVAGGRGFGTHPHRDMEILSYVVKGGLTHRDSMGNARTVEAGGVQYMSAGSGVAHSEYNASPTDPVHFLQIWIHPDERGAEPVYGEWAPAGPASGLVLAASPDGASGSLKIRQNAMLSIGRLAAGESFDWTLRPGSAGWLQMVGGTLDAGGEVLAAGDGLAVEGVGELTLKAGEPAHFLAFDLALAGN